MIIPHKIMSSNQLGITLDIRNARFGAAVPLHNGQDSLPKPAEAQILSMGAHYEITQWVKFYHDMI